MLGAVLSSAVLVPDAADGRGLVHAVIRCTDSAGLGSEEVESVIDIVRTTAEAEVAAVFKESTPGSWSVSLRSKDTVDVSAVAEPLGVADTASPPATPRPAPSSPRSPRCVRPSADLTGADHRTPHERGPADAGRAGSSVSPYPRWVSWRPNRSICSRHRDRGRLGALALAGLAVGGLVLAQVSTQLTFLSYGTTARASRLHGAGRERDAVREGVQATWLALGIGAVLVVAVQVLAGPVTSLIAGDGEIAAAAERWLRIAVFGAPLILVAMAGNGWMRGVQNTMRPLGFVLVGQAVSAVLCVLLVHGVAGAPRWELEGSAVANLAGQATSAALFGVALLRAGCRCVPAGR